MNIVARRTMVRSIVCDLVPEDRSRALGHCEPFGQRCILSAESPQGAVLTVVCDVDTGLTITRRAPGKFMIK